VRPLRAGLARAEPDDAGAVGRDRRVVAGHPEPARAVALAVRQLRDEHVAAGVELGLQARSVVAAARRGRRRAREDGNAQRGEQQRTCGGKTRPQHDVQPNALRRSSCDAPDRAYVAVPSEASSLAPASSAPYAARASAPPVETRRTPTDASSGIDGAAGRARTFTGADTASTTRLIWSRLVRPGAERTSAPASRGAGQRAILSSMSST